MVSELLVNEIFGPVWQGEGSQAGRLCVFVRLATCNLACVWCDTPYAVFFDDRKAALHMDRKTYDPATEIHHMTPLEIVERIMKLVPLNTLVVFSGGEPMLQADKIADVCEELYRNGYGEYAIETAGTRPIKPLQDLRTSQTMHFTVSPKLANSGNELERRLIWPRLREYADAGGDFKFVVCSEKDLLEVDSIARRCNLVPGQVWIMPEGTTSADVIWNARRLQQAVLDQGWNFTLRQQVILNDAKRGV